MPIFNHTGNDLSTKLGAQEIGEAVLFAQKFRSILVRHFGVPLE
jgi:hypothetical protein